MGVSNSAQQEHAAQMNTLLVAKVMTPAVEPSLRSKSPTVMLCFDLTLVTIGDHVTHRVAQS